MEHVKDGSIVQVIATGRIGEVISRKRSDVIVSFCDKSRIMPEDLTFKERELREVELLSIKTSQLGAFVCGDISLAEISNGTNLIYDRAEKDSEEYRISSGDIYAGVKHYEGKPAEEVYRWIDTVMALEDDMNFPDGMGKRIEDNVTDRDILSCVYEEMDELRWEICDYDPFDVAEGLLDNLKDILCTWVESGGR